MPTEHGSHTGNILGNQVVYDLLKERFDIKVVNLGLSSMTSSKSFLSGALYNVRASYIYIWKLLELKSLVRSESFDYFYFSPSSSLRGFVRDVISVFIVRSKGIKVIGHSRNGNLKRVFEWNYLQAIVRRHFLRIDRIIFLSEGLMKRVPNYISETKGRVVYNPIGKDVIFELSEVQTKIEIKRNSNVFQILYLSNMIRSKGYFDLLKALSNLDSSVQWRAVFVGKWINANDKIEFDLFCREYNIDSKVLAMGKISNRAQIKDILGNSHVLALPTYYPEEAQPRCIVEALNAGVPILSTYHASIPEMINDGLQGYLVEPNDIEALALSIKRICQKDSWYKMAIEARNRYDAIFHPVKLQKKLIEAILN